VAVPLPEAPANAPVPPVTCQLPVMLNTAGFVVGLELPVYVPLNEPPLAKVFVN
jgi:hypothetical protein